MKPKLLGCCGIATYVLSVLASATTLRGEPTAPTLLLAVSGTASVAFFTLAVMRLWRENRYLSAILGASQLTVIALSAMEAERSPAYGNSLIVATTVARLVAFVSLFWAIVTLFRLRDIPAARETRGNGVAQLPPDLADAQRVVIIWAKYIEYCQDRLRALFIAGIPESLLPYPLGVIEKALNDMGKYYHDRGDREGARRMQEAFGPLALYIKDEDALAGAAKKFVMPGLSAAIAENLRLVQRNWIRTQN